MSSTLPPQQEGSQRPLRLLSLDAGGVRSLFSISILKRIMSDINVALPAEEKLEPWQVFDIIGGTNTGGLVAIMLGRLQMSLDDCEVTFRELCEKIYRPKDPNDKRRDPKHHHYMPSKCDTEVLVETVKDLIRKKLPGGGIPEEVLLQTSGLSCTVLAPVSECEPIPLSSDEIISKNLNPKLKNSASKALKLWELCAASTASEGLFDPVTATYRSKELHFFASAAWDEPIHMFGTLLKQQWPGRNALLISIGSGVFAEKQIPISTDQIFKDNPDLVEADMWFRFNHDTILKDVLKEDFDKLDHILDAAKAYMDDNKVEGEFKACVGKLFQTYEMTGSASNR